MNPTKCALAVWSIYGHIGLYFAAPWWVKPIRDKKGNTRMFRFLAGTM